jgi:hypothetical protein
MIGTEGNHSPTGVSDTKPRRVLNETVAVGGQGGSSPHAEAKRGIGND